MRPSVRRTNHRVASHLVFGLRQVDLLIVLSRHAGDLTLAAEGIRHVVYDPSQRPPWWCFRFWILRLIGNQRVASEIRTLLTIVSVLRCRAIISSDAYRDLIKAEPLLRSAHLYFVQHGLFSANPDKARVLGKSFVIRDSDITLFSIGQFDRRFYVSGGIRPKRVIPIGTLKNSVYCQSMAANAVGGVAKSYDLCVVEKGIKAQPDSDFSKLRLDSWVHILSALNHYCHNTDFRVIVALSNSDDPSEVLQWIKRHFRYEFDVSDPLDPFATYRAVDQSEVTIGQSSTVLCEALSRHRKVLSVDYSTPSLFNLPGDGIAILKNPSLLEFAERIDVIRRLDWATYQKSLSEETIDLLGPDPRLGIHTISQTVRRDLAGY